MPYSHVVRQERFVFATLAELLAKANERKSGDELAGLAAGSEQERVAAKCALSDVTLKEIADQPVIDPDRDDVSRLILESHDQNRFAEICSLTVGQFREWLLESIPEPQKLQEVAWAITPEMAAAVAKLMSNQELVAVSSKIRIVTRLRNTMGEHGVLGIRVQPNHPMDDLKGILLSALDGLLFGCGDAVIGVNPATDSKETVSSILHGLDRLISHYAIPTQACCLAHITTQLACLEQGAPVDLLFQSIAGTQAANASFGITVEMLREGQQRTQESHQNRPGPWLGKQVMYFETGQGSALSADAHHGIDQLTLEARAYGLARLFDPFLVNSVVGFIGPEYLFDERQIIRAGLEDHFMGKLLGLPMGVDVCYTNHAEADQNSADNLMMLLALAGCNYFMGVPCADDIMLNYQSTSYHDAAQVRDLLQLRPAPEFHNWLEAQGIYQEGRLAPLTTDSRPLLLQSFNTLLKL
ncbi:MAG: ethanolamine ammonia-lyase subunit EutB [Planctomycetia bacterium]|nr:ethanolamine ammonia-lyase subunit EutB [Planctomycetia bacterium]